MHAALLLPITCIFINALLSDMFLYTLFHYILSLLFFPYIEVSKTFFCDSFSYLTNARSLFPYHKDFFLF